MFGNEFLTVHAYDVHPEANAGVRLQHALRLPPGTPAFNSVRSDAFHMPWSFADHAEGMPFDWLLHSSQYLICLNASGSLTLEFKSPDAYPFAVMVAIGTVDCLSGLPFDGQLMRTPQNYIPLPCQNWIDAWRDGNGDTRQFLPPLPGPPDKDGVPTPREDESDCLSIIFVPMKGDAFKHYTNVLDENAGRPVYGASDFQERFQETFMMLGRMAYEREKGEKWDTGTTHPDPFDADDWDLSHAQKVTVTLVRPEAWTKITGGPPEGPFFERQIYDDAGVPWSDEYAKEG